MHRPLTNILNFTLFMAFRSSSPKLSPLSDISAYTLLLKLYLGQPLFRFPWGSHFRAWRGTLGQVFWGYGQSNSPLSFGFVNLWGLGLFFSTGPHCCRWLFTRCLVSFWSRCWLMFAACVLCALLFYMFQIHTSSLVSRWSWRWVS